MRLEDGARLAQIARVSIHGLIAIVLGACGFDLRLGTIDDGRTLGDTSESDGIDMSIVPTACTSSATSGLVACFELEDDVTDGTLRDSSPSRLDATTVGLVATQRTKPAASAAATVTSIVATYVPDSPSLDLGAAYTVTMWVQANTAPGQGEVFGLFDHELQYAGVIASSPDGTGAHLRCINTNREYTYTQSFPINTWTFIACTWDGLNLCAQYWSTPTDSERECEIPIGVSTDGSHGLAIGHLSSDGHAEAALRGSFDSVQLYSRALGSTELCQMIGQPPGCLWQ